MPIKYCPHCNEAYMISNTTTDYIHTCNSGDTSLDQEDIKVTGNWEDSTGSAITNPAQIMIQGVENALQGTRGGNEGEKEHEYTDRGNIKSIYRQRQHEEFIEFKSASSSNEKE